jgi:multiple sugar transport system permease protein
VKTRWWVAYAFLAPGLLLIGIFFVLPAIAAFGLSLTDFDLYSLAAPADMRFIGVDNYTRLAHDPLFWQALANTAYFVFIGGPLSVGTSLAAALLLNARAVRWQPVFRTVYFAPVVTTLVAVAIVWRYLYDPRYGLLDTALGALGLPRIDWLGNMHWAMPALILMTVWKNFGYNMIVFIAGLQAIPGDLYDAARVDGASPWQRFRFVTIPGLAPTFLFVGVTTMIGYTQVFAEPYVMTQGGPLHATLSIVLYMYEQGFRWWRVGFAASIAVVLFLITLAATLLQLRRRREAPA